MRVLAPSIRTADLVRWCDDAGVRLEAAQWGEIDKLHDLYLAEVLAIRTHARERLTHLYGAADTGEQQPHELELRTERAAAGVNRDFSVQLASLDDGLIGSLRTAGLLTPAVAQSFAARRQFERMGALFAVAVASGHSPLLADNPDPIQLVLESWPQDSERDTQAIAAWTTRAVAMLLPSAQERWKLRCEDRALFIAAELAQDDPASSLDHNGQVAARLAVRRIKATAQANSAEGDAVRNMRVVLTEDAAGIPPRARADAMSKLMLRLGGGSGAASLERGYAAACEIAAEDAPLLAQIRLAREKWRLERTAWIEGASIDVQQDVARTSARSAELLARMPDERAREVVTAAFKSAANTQEPEAIVEEDAPDAAIEKYSAVRKIGLIAAPPPKHFLRTVARMAHLDEDQERLFIDDAQEQWRELMTAEAQRIERAEESLKKHEPQTWSDPDATSRAIVFAMNEAVYAPLASADALDAELVQTLIARAAAFGSRSEAAAALWRVVRALPADGWRGGSGSPTVRGNNDDFRAYMSGPQACVGVLACDTTLSSIVRGVLVDLIVAHQEELLAAARAVRVARSASIAPLVHALLQQQSDELAGKRAQFAALRDFRQVCDRFEAVQDSIVDAATALLPANDAHMLRYRRAELLIPEIFVGSGSHFASDRIRARAVAQPLFEQGGSALQLELEVMDLALRSAVLAALARDVDAQPTTKALDRLYRSDERLVEQSLRRVDQAVRAERDARVAPIQRR